MDRGAHFRRCDFQVHTPRDNGWSGQRPATDGERAAFADRLVAECRQKGIGAIAITDHHDFDYFPAIRDAAKRETDASGQPLPGEEQLEVFPGLELTLGVPCQALLILDADFPADRLAIVLEALAVPSVPSSEASLPPVNRIDHIQSLEQLSAILDQRAWLRGTYIVLPNVTDGGLGTLMRSGMQSKYKDMPCVGGYLDGSVTKIGEGNSRIFAGGDVAWGNKRIALFQTSDSRSDSFAQLGTYTSWVKWAAPTAEALRQACLAQESRISHEAPAIPSIYLTRVSVSNSKFLGPIELELNPQYNAIIGGRGTGKSTILEYIRWALCDQPTSGSDDAEVTNHAVRREHLVAATLAPHKAQVEVHFSLNGIRHVVRRTAGTDALLLRVGDGEMAAASMLEIRSLLPIDAYSQKQLSSVSVRIDEVTRFVTAPIRSQLDEIDTAALALAGKIRENYALLRRQRDLETTVARDELSSASLTQQAASLRDALGAVSEEDRALLAMKPSQDTADELVAALRRKADQLGDEASHFLSNIEAMARDMRDVPADTPNRAVVLQLHDAVAAAVAAVRESALGAQRAVSDRVTEGSEYHTALEKWTVVQGEYEALYTAAKARSAAHKSKLDELSDVERRSRQLRAGVEKKREELRGLGDPRETHKTLRADWFSLQGQRSGLLEEQCSALTGLSGGLIRATLRRGAGFSAVGERLRGAISGSGVRGAKIDTLIEGLARDDDPVATWEAGLAELEPDHATASPVDEPRGAGPLARLGLTSADISKMVDRLTPDSWLGLALAQLDDQPQFEYQVKDQDYIDFSDASPGQQATALLQVLLNQSGPPLLIDQPEDDLDSPVILKVVEQIWRAKTRRQLIFTSHNPNLVVNGDAELVVCCDYRAAGDHSGGKIKLEGAIDMPDVRTEITSVMEGGEKAFRLRKEKYGF